MQVTKVSELPPVCLLQKIFLLNRMHHPPAPGPLLLARPKVHSLGLKSRIWSGRELHSLFSCCCLWIMWGKKNSENTVLHRLTQVGLYSCCTHTCKNKNTQMHEPICSATLPCGYIRHECGWRGMWAGGRNHCAVSMKGIKQVLHACVHIVSRSTH